MNVVTGERLTTRDGGFNPSWQRHVAAYRQCAALLDEGRVLDLGCGIGHSFELLAPRPSVGLDIAHVSLVGQKRPVVRADMRVLPFVRGSFASVFSNQSLEHVPDPGLVVAECARILVPGGVAVFVTPNRLTFGRPDEVIDPYHYVEFDADELRALCERSFERVEVRGMFGSPRYQEHVQGELRELDRLLRLDPLRLRRLVPRRLLQILYDRKLTSARATPRPLALSITTEDFTLGAGDLRACLDVVAICRSPRR